MSIDNLTSLCYNDNMLSYPQTFRIHSETNLKLRLLSISTNTPMCKIIEGLVEELWEKEEKKVSNILSQRPKSKRAKQLLRNIRVR